MISAVIGQDAGVRHEVAPLRDRTLRLRLGIALTPHQRQDSELLQGGNHLTAEEIDRLHGGLMGHLTRLRFQQQGPRYPGDL
jgi:hypothetical protein